jgi:hypothetical protein
MEIDEYGRTFGVDEEIGEFFDDVNGNCPVVNFIC